ncbi:Pathogenic type III effector avirulence factor Avr cleavage site [Corchorus olitorius]|uniref:Pathogenic type III effector avirulence factor Avr cleavage site n=1 Tax=Corchorus olitorius TaxID=93759 RepID=A0A1R3KFF4_9ROSI|nr:Pathogenic type III effector avirulence factor Avr cleavage site [Corchorus olitorius]
MAERGRPLPKFGEWDVNNPATAEGFTVIFNKARHEKKTRAATPAGNIINPPPSNEKNNIGAHSSPPPPPKVLLLLLLFPLPFA